MFKITTEEYAKSLLEEINLLKQWLDNNLP